MMIDKSPLDLTQVAADSATAPGLRQSYYFHDICLSCISNDPAIFAILDEMLGMFPVPTHVRATATYAIICYESAAHFPMRLPRDSVRTETVSLVTETTLKCYTDHDHTLDYQRFEALPPLNEAALSVIDRNQPVALTQLEIPERYKESFLRRYIFLLALGQLLRQFDFEACHAAAVNAPWDATLGALIIGESGSGKTTLSIGCAAEGFGFLGDDLVMLRREDTAGSIDVYAISHEVSVRSDSLFLLPKFTSLLALPADRRDKRYCSIEHMRPGAAQLRAPVRLLLFPQVADAAQNAVTQMHKAQVLRELVAQCMRKGAVAAEEQAQLFRLLSSLAEQAPGFKVAIARGSVAGPQIVRQLFTGGAA